MVRRLADVFCEVHVLFQRLETLVNDGIIIGRELNNSRARQTRALHGIKVVEKAEPEVCEECAVAAKLVK
jgi:hypothetical protein